MSPQWSTIRASPDSNFDGRRAGDVACLVQQLEDLAQGVVEFVRPRHLDLRLGGDARDLGVAPRLGDAGRAFEMLPHPDRDRKQNRCVPRLDRTGLAHVDAEPAVDRRLQSERRIGNDQVGTAVVAGHRRRPILLDRSRLPPARSPADRRRRPRRRARSRTRCARCAPSSRRRQARRRSRPGSRAASS